MAQHDYTIANQTFPATRTDLNNALAATVTQNSGASAPSTTYAYQLWYDTSTNKLKQRNANDDAWIDLFDVDQTADTATAAGSVVAAGSNLIINGAMQVAQRGTQTNQTTAFTACDRFDIAINGAAIVTTSQDTTVPSGQGFSNSLKIDVTTADSSLAASDLVVLRHKIEAQNLQHLLYGTSDAKNITLSFWVRSPKTGTHIIELRHVNATYYNSQAYTINTADTWQNVTVTFDGYTATAFNNDNGLGLVIDWWLAAGSTFSGGTLSSNTWHNIEANRAVGQVNVADSTSNDFYLTGVQLEIGDVATPFEHRSYGDELLRCQRYFTTWNVGWSGVSGGAGYQQTSTVSFPVQMNHIPDIARTGGTNSTRYPSSAWLSFFINIDGFVGNVTAQSAGGNESWQATGTADAEL